MFRNLFIDGIEYVEFAGPFKEKDEKEMEMMAKVLKDAENNQCKIHKKLNILGEWTLYRQTKGMMFVEHQGTLSKDVCQKCGRLKDTRPGQIYSRCYFCHTENMKANYRKKKGL